MPRIAGIDLAPKKKVWIALTSIYGIGRSNVHELLRKANVIGDKQISELNAEEISRLQKVLDTAYEVEGTLRKDIRDNVERLKRIRSYRGLRHIAALPSRGQRTKTNARTRRGKRRTVGALSKELTQKLEEAKKAA
jgi:small subunit ribosomal protein S13